MARKVTVKSNKTQQVYRFENVEVNTLADLKKLLTDNGIDYSDMSFYEGISKAEYLSNDSVFPATQVYRGEETTDLIFMLTPSKKIASGASVEELEKRVEALEAVVKKIAEACGYKPASDSSDDDIDALFDFVPQR